MRIPLISKINKKIGIDLGTGTTRIWVEGKGVVSSETTCLAFDKKTRNVVAFGSQARDMDGRVGPHIEVVYPVQNGEVYDDVAVRAFLKILLNEAIGSTTMLNPIMMISIPTQSTQAARQIITEILYNLGAGEVYTIAQPLAASIGSGVPIADISGSFFLHLGEGSVEGVVISLGSIISEESTELAGAYFADKLRLFTKEEFNLKISRGTAVKLISNVASLDNKAPREMLAGGQDISNENPKEVMMTSKDLFDETMLYMERLEGLLRKLLSKMPPELTVDVIDKGLLLSGGLAQLDNIERLFIEKLGIPVSVVDNPDQVVINGIGIALEHLELFKNSLGYQE